MAGYISKNKADWLFQEIFCDEEYCGGSCYKCGKEVQYRNKLLQEPDADVQPISHGRWENEYLDDDDVWWADCTNCNNDAHSRFGKVSIYAYCPNCGAKMDAEPDEPWQSE